MDLPAKGRARTLPQGALLELLLTGVHPSRLGYMGMGIASFGGVFQRNFDALVLITTSAYGRLHYRSHEPGDA
ncbi:hypothetical protein BV25DRAFT_1922760 [Artomyces pyxidatus]|uniref:Uncharacterized protein n=1 Tax=Artomyces pyxidatus TaxID=48021 RepID=A0ACB8SCS7_9AGAM|nr:hypothetical protein BV25DRAFT_1922760 [Artomyces pyxidatus]